MPKKKVTMDTLLSEYEYDDACRAGVNKLHLLVEEMRRDPTFPRVILTYRRVLFPIGLGVFIMEETKAGNRYYSVVTHQEVEKETVQKTNIPKSE
jgi:hypothetical protein